MNALALHTYGPAAQGGLAPNGGVPLVLLHGFPLDSRMWQYAISAMPSVPVVAVDAPGFGASPPLEDSEPSLDLFANAVAASLSDAGIDQAVIAGLSMGGYSTLALLDRHPHLFAGVALLDTKASADSDAARDKRLAMADAALGPAGSAAVAPMIDTILGPTSHASRPDLIAEVTQWLAQAPPEAIAWAQEAMAARPDRHDVLASFHGPALVLRGAEDELATADDHKAMARLLGVDVVVVAGAGHMPALESPHTTGEALAAFYHRVVAGR